MSTDGTAARTPLASIKIMAFALTAAGPVITLVLFFVLPHDARPPMVSVAVVLVGGLVALAGLRGLGYRTPAIPAGTDAPSASATALGSFQSLAFMRLALAEVPLLIGIGMAFGLPPTSWFTSVLGAVVSLLLAGMAWPGERSIERVRSNLERAGGLSFLHDALTGRRPG